MSNPVDDTKQALRRRLLAARASTAGAGAASAAVRRRLGALPDLVAARTVVGYAAQGTELSIDATLEALLATGVTVCVPWVDGPLLGLGAITGLDELAPGWRGLREPAVPRRPVRPHAVDAVIAPGVGFDLHGNRLGYGGGHFDRLLARLRRGVPVIGVAFDEQVVDRLPVAPHDRPVDLVVTPTRTLRAARL